MSDLIISVSMQDLFDDFSDNDNDIQDGQNLSPGFTASIQNRTVELESSNPETLSDQDIACSSSPIFGGRVRPDTPIPCPSSPSDRVILSRGSSRQLFFSDDDVLIDFDNEERPGPSAAQMSKHDCAESGASSNSSASGHFHLTNRHNRLLTQVDEDSDISISPSSALPSTSTARREIDAAASHKNNSCAARRLNHSASYKRKRSPYRNHPTGNAARRYKTRRNAALAETSARPTNAVNDSDSDIELLSISNSVGDITLANINQMENDEAYARRLHAILNEEQDDEAATTTRNAIASASTARNNLPQQRSRRPIGATGFGQAAGATARHFSPPPSIFDDIESNLRRGYLESRRRERPVASRTRSASNRAAADLFIDSEDDDVQPIEEFFMNPRNFNAGRIRSVNNRIERPGQQAMPRSNAFLHAFLAEDDPPQTVRPGGVQAQRAARNRANFIPTLHFLLNSTELFADEIIDLDFENVLDMAERIGEVRTGLTNAEVEAYTTEKYFSITTTGHSNDTCTICMTEFSQDEHLTVLPCLHDFHRTCVATWLQNKPTCPICRVDVRQ